MNYPDLTTRWRIVKVIILCQRFFPFRVEEMLIFLVYYVLVFQSDIILDYYIFKT